MSPTLPTSSATWTQRTRRSISPTATTISSARTTLPSSPPQIQKVCRAQEHPAPAKQQQAEFLQRSDLQATGNRWQIMRRDWGNFGQRICCNNRFLVHSRKVREIKTQTLCIRSKIERISKKSLNGKLTRPFEERWWLSKNCVKLRLKLRQARGQSRIWILSDFEYTKQVDGQIRLREKRLVCMENWNWEIGSSKKIMQGIAKKLKNWEANRARQARRWWIIFATREGIPQPWVKWWLRFGNCRTKWIPCPMQENFTILNEGAALERPTFPIELLLFYVPEPCRCAILDCRVIHWKVRVLEETFFERPSAQEGLSSTILNNSKNFGILSGIEAWYYRIYKEERKRWKENRWTRLFKCLTSKVEVECWIILVELILTVVWWIIREFLLRIGILEIFLTLWNFKAGKSTSELRFVHEQPILRSPCSGSKKLRLPNDELVRHRDRLQGSTIFLTSICLMRWLRQPWRSFSKRRHISENSKCRRAASS